MFCNKCGNKVNENEKFCNNCGEPITVQQEEQPKKSNTGLIIGCIIGALVFIILLIVIIIITVFMLIPKDTNTSGSRTTSTIIDPTTTTKSFDDDKKENFKNLDFTNVSFKAEDNDKTERAKNIEFVYANMNKSSGNNPSASVAFINKNSENIDINIHINYYKDNQRIGSDSYSNSFVKPNVITVYEISLSNKEEYDTFDITYETSKAATYMVDVPVNSSNYKTLSDDKEGIYGKLTNNTKEEIYAYASCVRYKDDKIVFVQPGYIGSVKAGKTENCRCFKSSVPDGIEYDKTTCTPHNVYYSKGE